MEELLANIRHNPFLLWFLVAFVVLWGGGMVWCGVLVVRSLGKRRSALRALRSAGFEKVSGGPRERREQIKNLALNTLCSRLAASVDPHPRNELLRISEEGGTIRFSYHLPEDEHRPLSRAVGLRERVQIVGRDLVLKRILHRPEGGGAFYAETKNTETVRAHRPAKRIRSTSGWALCFAGDTRCASTVTIHTRLTGHRGLLVGMAFKLAGIRPAPPEGLVPEFAAAFEVLVSGDPSAGAPLDEQVQRTILASGALVPEGLQLHINPHGVWLTAEEWPDGERMKRMVRLCDELTGGRPVREAGTP